MKTIHNPITYNNAIKFIVKDKENDFFNAIANGQFTTYNLKGEPIKTIDAIKLGCNNVFFEMAEIHEFIKEIKC